MLDMFCSRCKTDVEIIYFSKSRRNVYYRVCDICKAKTIYNKCLTIGKRYDKSNYFCRLNKNCPIRLHQCLLKYGDLVHPTDWLYHPENMIVWNRNYNVVQSDERLKRLTMYEVHYYYHYNQNMFNISNRKFLNEIKISSIKRVIHKLKLPDVLINVIFNFLY